MLIFIISSIIKGNVFIHILIHVFFFSSLILFTVAVAHDAAIVIDLHSFHADDGAFFRLIEPNLRGGEF